MRTFYSPYKLTYKRKFTGLFKSNEGFLLKFINESGQESYSLYHPIESLGDLPLKDFIFHAQKRDHLVSKIKKLSLFQEEVLEGSVESYYSAPSQEYLIENEDEVFKNDFRLIKLKYSNLSEIDFVALRKMNFRYIFDFNGREEFKNFIFLSEDKKNFLQDYVEYIEDPYNEMKIPSPLFNLASDFIDYANLAKYQILKPTGFCRDEKKIRNQSTVVTSYIDHPLGQLLSAKWAIENKVSNVCGLWTHIFFEENSYSAFFDKNGIMDLSISSEFINLLEKENWRPM